MRFFFREKKQKKAEQQQQQQECDQKKETHPGIEAAEADAIVEGPSALFTADSTPENNCCDFVAEELSKIVQQLNSMKADMTEEEHADAMASLILLRDEAR